MAPAASWEGDPGHSATLTPLGRGDVTNWPCLLVCSLSPWMQAASLATQSLSANTPLRASTCILPTNEAFPGASSLYPNLVSLCLSCHIQEKVAFKVSGSQRKIKPCWGEILQGAVFLWEPWLRSSCGTLAIHVAVCGITCRGFSCHRFKKGIEEFLEKGDDKSTDEKRTIDSLPSG